MAGANPTQRRQTFVGPSTPNYHIAAEFTAWEQPAPPSVPATSQASKTANPDGPPDLDSEVLHFDPDSPSRFRDRWQPYSIAESGLRRWTLLTSGRRRIPIISLLPAFVAGLLVAYFGDPSIEHASLTMPRFTTTFGRPAMSFSFSSLQPTSPYSVHPTNGHVYLEGSFESRLWSTGFPSNDATTQNSHPIMALIHNASIEWNAKLSRQSKTLQQAVSEYQRRYKRKPPKGFQQWWNWAKENGVVLVDEYDRIHETMEPFWALSPAVIEKRRERYLKHDVFNTFIIKDGVVKNVGGRSGSLRAKDQLKLIQPFLKYLPDMNITMSHHDGPSNFLDWNTREKHLKYARSGQVLKTPEVDRVDDNAALWGWNLACPPDSRIRKADLGLEIDVLPRGPSFVGLEHAKTMDVCENPEWRYLHGFTSWPGPRPGVLNPIFSFASTSISTDLLSVPLEQFGDSEVNYRIPTWAEKDRNQLLWKGRTTGVWFDQTTRWRSSQRVRLHAMGTSQSESRRVRFLESLDASEQRHLSNGYKEKSHAQAQAQNLVKMVEKEVKMSVLNELYLNASFVGELWQCSKEDGSCEAVGKEIKFDPYIDWNEQNMFKYVFDVDGNSWSGRFRRLLASHSVVFKSTIWPEWYRDHIQPWYHYVPTRIDYSDVYDIMAFFTGNLDGEWKHDEVAQGIASQAFDWVHRHWRYEDLQAYAWRTYLEWARITSDDRDKMDFTLQN